MIIKLVPLRAKGNQLQLQLLYSVADTSPNRVLVPFDACGVSVVSMVAESMGCMCSPMGGTPNWEKDPPNTDPTVIEIAKKYNKTPNQVSYS